MRQHRRDVYDPAHRFNSRTPCGVRLVTASMVSLSILFQFTHPVRGATRGGREYCPTLTSFNSRTPCGVRHDNINERPRRREFQFTHPVRGATLLSFRNLLIRLFQFTHPVRGATTDLLGAYTDSRVSIHAPRAGCDRLTYAIRRLITGFNSRTPCGVRLFSIDI